MLTDLGLTDWLLLKLRKVVSFGSRPESCERTEEEQGLVGWLVGCSVCMYPTNEVPCTCSQRTADEGDGEEVGIVFFVIVFFLWRLPGEDRHSAATAAFAAAAIIAVNDLKMITVSFFFYCFSRS